MRKRQPSRQSLGQQGERLAAAYLQRQGYSIIARNYRCRYGEIDLIARLETTLVFVEVKTRSGLSHGIPAAAVTPHKQRQLSKVALYYLDQHQAMEQPARFDVVAILLPSQQSAQIELIPNAFELCYG